MKRLKTLVRRTAGLCLAVLLTVPVLAAEPLDPAKRQEDLDIFYEEVLMKGHPNAFANASEAEFLALKADIEGRLETVSDTEFLLDLMRLTALVGDSHTSISVGSAAAFRAYPFALVRTGTGYGERWYLSAVPSEHEALLCQEVTALAGEPVGDVIDAFGTLFSADNPVYLKRQFRQACNVADIYEYLGLVEAGEPLTIALKNGESLTLEPMGMEEMGELGAARLSDRVEGTPETAAQDVYYFSKPLSEEVYYIQYNVCREDEDLPMEEFAAQVAKDLEEGGYWRVLLDLRYNGGGSDGVIWPLLEVLRKEMDDEDGLELVGLIGERTFSSALINAVEIQEMGGVLAGEPTGGSVCHFGAVRTFSLPNSKVRGQVSSKYIDLNTLLDAAAGRGVVSLEPDEPLTQPLEHTLNGTDSVVEHMLTRKTYVPRLPIDGAPLTRGRFIGQLYEAAGSPDVEIGEALPFADSFGIEWYLPALAWAKENGIAKGYADGTFSAAKPLTWREAAVFLGRAAGALGLSPDPAADRSGPVPAALAQGGDRDAAAAAWDLGLLPAEAGSGQGLTRAQGEALAERLGSAIG